MVLEFLPSTIWLLLVSFSFGFALTREKSLITIGFGIAAIAVVSMAFNLVGIPLNWVIFLVIAIAILGYFIYKKELDLKVERPERAILLVLLMALINVLVFWNGSNAYPYLEDGDPWIHATGVKWVKMTESFSTHFDAENFQRLYIEPYPPAYDVLLGILHQMTLSVTQTLRFFNVLLVGMALVAAFYCFDVITGNRRLALFATFLLLALPSFMSHFIWAQTLSMLLLFVSFYGLERGLKDKKYIVPTAVAIASIAVTQPSTAAIFVFLAGMYLVAKFLSTGKEALKPIIIMGVLGLLISMIYWVPITIKYGTELTMKGIGITPTKFTSSTEDTSGGIVYSISDFVFAPSASKIDQQTGIGLVISILAVVGFALALLSLKGKREAWLLFALMAMVFCVIGTEGNAMPVKLFPHRFWVFLSIPVALLASYAYLDIENRFKDRKRILQVLLFIGVFITSASPKMTVQTATWPPGPEFTSQEELIGYIQMKDALPKDTMVFPVCSSDDKVMGSDMLSEAYDRVYDDFKRSIADKTAQEAYNFLKGRGYQYVIFDSTCSMTLGPEKAQLLLNEYLLSGHYTTETSNGGFIALKLN